MPENQSLKPQVGENIFDEFVGDEKSMDTLEQKNAKDMYHYFQKITLVLKVLNVLGVICIVLFLFYVSFQTSTKNMNLSIFDPICGVFLGSASSDFSSCQGVSNALAQKSQQFDEIKTQQFQKITSIIGDVYALENFVYSKEVSFLVDKSSNRARPIETIVAFNSIKTAFEPTEKSKLRCFDMTILDGNILEVTCDAYSSDWDREIVGYDGNKINSDVEGTSISVANSFLNFIEKSSNSNFYIQNRQKVFTIQDVSGEGVYTKKTPFEIKLIYKPNNS